MSIPYGTLRDIADELKNIREILERQSTTEQSSKVGERKRGKWVAIQAGSDWNYGILACSECKIAGFTTDTPFCPNCGADMRGSEDE